MSWILFFSEFLLLNFLWGLCEGSKYWTPENVKEMAQKVVVPGSDQKRDKWGLTFVNSCALLLYTVQINGNFREIPPWLSMTSNNNIYTYCMLFSQAVAVVGVIMVASSNPRESKWRAPIFNLFYYVLFSLDSILFFLTFDNRYCAHRYNYSCGLILKCE